MHSRPWAQTAARRAPRRLRLQRVASREVPSSKGPRRSALAAMASGPSGGPPRGWCDLPELPERPELVPSQLRALLRGAGGEAIAKEVRAKSRVLGAEEGAEEEAPFRHEPCRDPKFEPVSPISLFTTSPVSLCTRTCARRRHIRRGHERRSNAERRPCGPGRVRRHTTMNEEWHGRRRWRRKGRRCKGRRWQRHQRVRHGKAP